MTFLDEISFFFEIQNALGFYTLKRNFEIGQKLEKILKKNREILIMKIQQNGLRRKSYKDYVMWQLLFQKEIFQNTKYHHGLVFGPR